MSKYSLQNVISNILQYNSTYLRKALNKDVSITSVLSSSDEFIKEYGATIKEFEKRLEEAIKENKSTFTTTASTGKEVSFETETAKKVIEGKGTYGTYYGLYRKLIPGLAQKWQLGHKSASVLTLRIAATIDSLKVDSEANKPLILQLQRLLKVSRQIDEITKDSNFSLDQIYSMIAKAVKAPTRVNASLKRELGVLTNNEQKIVLEFENAELNKLKGQAGAIVGTLVNKLLRGQVTSIEEGIRKVDISEIISSPSMMDDIATLLHNTIDPKRKRKPIKRSAKTKTKAVAGPSIPKLKQIPKATLVPEKKVKKVPQLDYFSVIPMINASLPEAVRARMRPPALMNRTGQFAESARVVDVIRTPKGFPSFGYTYEKNPYQVFEMGIGRAPWATNDRDPRNIIEGAIRDIARGVMDQRFFLRRL